MNQNLSVVASRSIVLIVEVFGLAEQGQLQESRRNLQTFAACLIQRR